MKKFLSLMVAAVAALACVMFAGCAKGITVDEIKERGKLIVVTNAEFPPFEYKEGDAFVGVDMEIAAIIAEEMGVDLEIVDTNFDSVILNVNSGKADIALAGLTWSESRAKSVDFSESYWNASQYLIVSEDDTTFDDCETADDIVAKLNDMGSDLKIAYQRGTTGDLYANGDEEWGFDGFSQANKVGAANGGLAVADLIGNRANVVVIDEQPARSLVAANAGVKLIDIALTEELYVIAVRQNSSELLKFVNDVMTEIKNNGRFQAIIDKYFGDDAE